MVLALPAALAVLENKREKKPDTRWTPSTSAVLVGGAFVVLANVLFFTKMFWLERYGLPAHPLILVAACGALFSVATRNHKPLFQTLPWLPIFVAVMLGAFAMRAPTEPDAAPARLMKTIDGISGSGFDTLEIDTQFDEPIVDVVFRMIDVVADPFGVRICSPIDEVLEGEVRRIV